MPRGQAGAEHCAERVPDDIRRTESRCPRPGSQPVKGAIELERSQSRTLSEAGQIQQVHRVLDGEQRQHRPPPAPRTREAMHQHEWRSRARGAPQRAYAAHLDRLGSELDLGILPCAAGRPSR
jgi:hypothetical protein